VALEEEEDSRVGCGLDWDKEMISLKELCEPADLLPFKPDVILNYSVRTPARRKQTNNQTSLFF